MKRRIYAILIALCLILNMASGVALATEVDPDSTVTPETTVVPDGHTRGDWVVITKATCTTTGLQKVYCTDPDCGIELESEEIPMVAHVPETQHCKDDYVDPTCTTDGHDWTHCSVCPNLIVEENGEWVIVAADDERVVIPATGHTFVGYAAVEPTCTEAGNNEYRACEICGASEPGHEKVEIPANGHGEPIPAEDYILKCDPEADDEHSYDKSVDAVCSICGVTLEEEIVKPAPHTWVEGLEGLAPTCTEWGYTEYKECSVCGRIEGKVDLEPLGHKWKYYGALAGSCTEPGRHAGYACSDCGIADPDRPGYEPIPAPGHTDDIVLEAVAPTCTETGLTEGKKCSKCGAITVEQEVVPALGHDWMTVLGKKATCEEDGYGAHSVCRVCGEKQYVDPETAVIPAHGHSDQDGFYPENAETVANGKANTERKHDEDEYDDTWMTESEQKKQCEATCLTDGYTGEKLCVFCNEVREASKIESAKGHDWVLTVPGILPDCTHTGISDQWDCSRCDAHFGGEIINARGHKMVPVEETLPICEALPDREDPRGNFAYEYCSVCGFATNKEYLVDGVQDMVEPLIDTVVYSTGLIETEMPEEGHPVDFIVAPYDHCYKEPVKALAPTCTENGIEEGAERCLLCNQHFNLTVIPRLNHPDDKIHYIDGQPADCTADGWISYTWCDECGKAVASNLDTTYDEDRIGLDASEVSMPEEGGHPGEFVLEALGHDPADGVALEPTCTEDGHTAGKYCSRCKLTIEEYQILPKLGHTEEIIPAVDPTCTETGLTEGKKCSVCGVITLPQKVAPAAGHDAGEVTEPKPATCEEFGYGKGVHCTKCDVNYDPVLEYLLSGGIMGAADIYEAGWLKVPELEEPLGHNLINVIGYDAECEEDGLKDYVYCERCGKAAEGTLITEGIADLITASKVIKPEESDPVEFVIPALGHDCISVPGGEKTAPTCTKAGTDGIEQCVRCGKVQAKVVAALGHDWVHHEFTDATCAADGNIEYDDCSRCDLIRVDGTEYTENDVVIPQHELHDNLVHVDAVMATCTEAGHSDGQKCEVCGYEEYTVIEPDADAYHAFLSTEEELAKIEWVITSEGDGTIGSGMQAKLCPHCGYMLDVKLYPEVRNGDVNMDGRPDALDALMILQYKSGVISTLPNMVAADYNGDGEIDARDALGILNDLAF